MSKDMRFNSIKFFLLFVGIMSFNSLFSQVVSNSYLKGLIETENSNIGIVIEIKSYNNETNSYLYIPEQFVYAEKASNTTADTNSLEIEFKKFNSKIVASFSGDTISALWIQAGMEFKLSLDTIDQSEILYLNRPQTPKPPFSYLQKEIIIENEKANLKLAGTLTIPDLDTIHTLVILVSGSGAQDRNEEIAGHKPFHVIADYLTNNGIAVFRYDDRGTGKSTGSFANSTTYDFMTDAASVLKFFQNYPNIDADNIGIIGHSEGGMIAWILAAKYPKDIGFVISLAGPGVDIDELMLKQVEDVNRSVGIPEEHTSILLKVQKESMEIASKAKDMAEIRKMITDLYEKYGENFTEEEKNEYMLNQQGINVAVMQLSSPWMKYFLEFKPNKYLKKLKCPVLALNGTKDIQVDADANLKAIKEGLNIKKCKTIEVYKLEGLNHLFQIAEEGTVAEYYYLNETFSIDVLIKIENFINDLTK